MGKIIQNLLVFISAFVLVAGAVYYQTYMFETGLLGEDSSFNNNITSEAHAATRKVGGLLDYTFLVDGVLQETGSMEDSTSPYWWLNSGGKFILEDGVGRTIFGKTSSGERWHELYQDSNPRDTDNGLHPQNLLRLVTKSKWQDFGQQVYFNIRDIHESNSEYRNASNGVLLFNRYIDSDNLYYTGVRVDGHAVIKKKINGQYHTLAYERVFGGGEYNRENNPNLIPESRNIGLRSIVQNRSDGSVEVLLYVDEGAKGDWKLKASAVDDEGSYGRPIRAEGYAGIRSDFMDVEFDNYQAEELSSEQAVKSFMESAEVPTQQTSSQKTDTKNKEIQAIEEKYNVTCRAE